MRVLLIANIGWYLRNFRSRLVEHLESQGYEVVLAAQPDAETDGVFFRVRRFEPLRLSRKGRNPILELLAVLGFVRLFRRVRPDLVLTWTAKPDIYGGIAGRLLRITVIPNVSGLGVVFSKEGILARLVGTLYALAFARSPVVFFQNEEDRIAFIAARRVREAQAKRLPGSGVDLDYFQPKPIPSGTFVFLYVGRLLAEKGLRELVEAGQQLRREGFRFVLRIAGFLDAGNPTVISKQELHDWVTSSAVEYIGSFDDVRPALAAAHCVVLPSYRREGVPRSLLEAAAVARPVITTDAPGCRDAVLPGKSGLLCQVRNVESLVECMRRMLNLSPPALAAMGAAGREYMERDFSEEIVLHAYLDQCARLLK